MDAALSATTSRRSILPRQALLAQRCRATPALMTRWDPWASLLSEEQTQERISYDDLEGRAWVQPLWQLVLHVVNHGTHHRGQVAGFLRMLGHKPPALDLTAYYREKL